MHSCASVYDNYEVKEVDQSKIIHSTLQLQFLNSGSQ